MWGPDDTHVIYQIALAGLLRKRADGAGSRERLCQTVSWPMGFQGEDDAMLMTSVGGRAALAPLTGGGIGVQSLDTCEERWLVTPQQGQFMLNPALSPDEQWMAYEFVEGGQSEIYVRAFPDVDNGFQRVSTAGGLTPVWSRDGSELFYLEPGSPAHLMVVPVTLGDTLQLGRPTPLFEWAYQEAGVYLTRPFDIAPDGQRFLVLKPEEATTEFDLSQLSRVNVIQNWFTELNRLVPTD